LDPCAVAVEYRNVVVGLCGTGRSRGERGKGEGVERRSVGARSGGGWINGWLDWWIGWGHRIGHLTPALSPRRRGRGGGSSVVFSAARECIGVHFGVRSSECGVRNV